MGNSSDTEAAFLNLHLSISNDIFLPKFIINVTILFLKLSISHVKMVMFLALHPMESISLNLFVKLEHLAILLTLTLAIVEREVTIIMHIRIQA